MIIELLIISIGLVISAVNRTQGAIASFLFHRSECLNSSITDTSGYHYLGTLYRQNKNIDCLSSNGIDIAGHYVSSSNIERLQSVLGTNNFSIETWIQNDQSISIGDASGGFQMRTAFPENLIFTFISSTSTEIITFSSPNQPTLQPSRQPTVKPTTHPSKQLIVQPTLQSSRQPSQKSNVQTNRASNISHVVATISFETVRISQNTLLKLTHVGIYVNGQFWGNKEPDGYQKFWDASSWQPTSRLNLMPSPSSHNVLGNATMFLFAIYNKLLSQNEINQNFLAKLPYSDPVVSSFSVNIQEDGEVGDHSNDPTFYLKPIPSIDIQSIKLTEYDLDDDSVSPNYDITGGKSTLIQVMSLPSDGILYHLNGSKVVLGVPRDLSKPFAIIPRDAGTGSHFVRYRPPANRYNTKYVTLPIATFSYRAVDGITGRPSLSIATVSVYIRHIDKPPVPTKSLVSVVVAGVISSIVLSGIDYDSAVVNASIDKLPLQGKLYYDSRGQTPINTTNIGSLKVLSAETGKISFATAWYFYSGSQILSYLHQRSDGVVAQDVLYFSLKDKEGRYSVSQAVNISVVTSIRALPSVLTATPEEGKCSRIQLSAKDVSIRPKNLKIQILSTPELGSMYTSPNCTAESQIFPRTVLSGVMLAPRYNNVSSIYFKGINQYFSYPFLAWNGSVIPSNRDDKFEFLAYSVDNINISSTVSTQIIRIRNVNDPTTITYTATGKWMNGIKIHALSATDSSDGIPSEAEVYGFRLNDPDRGVDIVKARVHSARGVQFKLNVNYVSRVDFNSITYCYNDRWTCEGTGFGDTTAVFLGLPEDIEAALNGINIQSTIPNILDNITITIYDGEGGECLDNEQLNSALNPMSNKRQKSIRRGCLVTSTSFKVQVVGYGSSLHPKVSAQDKETIMRFLYIAAGVVGCLCLGCLRCCYKRGCPKHTKRLCAVGVAGCLCPLCVVCCFKRGCPKHLWSDSDVKKKKCKDEAKGESAGKILENDNRGNNVCNTSVSANSLNCNSFNLKTSDRDDGGGTARLPVEKTEETMIGSFWSRLKNPSNPANNPTPDIQIANLQRKIQELQDRLEDKDTQDRSKSRSIYEHNLEESRSYYAQPPPPHQQQQQQQRQQQSSGYSNQSHSYHPAPFQQHQEPSFSYYLQSPMPPPQSYQWRSLQESKTTSRIEASNSHKTSSKSRPTAFTRPVMKCGDTDSRNESSSEICPDDKNNHDPRSRSADVKVTIALPTHSSATLPASYSYLSEQLPMTVEQKVTWNLQQTHDPVIDRDRGIDKPSLPLKQGRGMIEDKMESNSKREKNILSCLEREAKSRPAGVIKEYERRNVYLRQQRRQNYTVIDDHDDYDDDCIVGVTLDRLAKSPTITMKSNDERNWVNPTLL